MLPNVEGPQQNWEYYWLREVCYVFAYREAIPMCRCMPFGILLYIWFHRIICFIVISLFKAIPVVPGGISSWSYDILRFVNTLFDWTLFVGLWIITNLSTKRYTFKSLSCLKFQILTIDQDIGISMVWCVYFVLHFSMILGFTTVLESLSSLKSKVIMNQF